VEHDMLEMCAAYHLFGRCFRIYFVIYRLDSTHLI